VKHSIINDFNRWNLIMEAGPGTVPNYDGPPEQTVSGTAPAPQAGPPAPAPAPQAAPTAPVAPAAPTKEVSAPGVPEGDADTAIMPTAAITNADGKLTQADAKIIQQVLIKTGNLPAKQASGNPSDDGKVGPGTKEAIGYFRQSFGIYDDPAVVVNPQTGLTVGPKTLAQVNAVIAKPETK
jgi:peptidoglycan hydrolase-like protein with peptidoglycan-binding domain